MKADDDFQRNMKNAAEQMLVHIHQTDYAAKWQKKGTETTKKGRPKKREYPSIQEIKDLIIEDCIETYDLKKGFWLTDIDRCICDYCEKKGRCNEPNQRILVMCAKFVPIEVKK
jgi:hypothetical protein